MNQRIRELAEQVGAGWDDKYHWYVGSETMKKIAELIVRECAKIVEGSSLPDAYSEPCLELIADDIRGHFGVK